MFLKTKILSIVAIGLVFVGCGDETYNCQNEKFAKEAYYQTYFYGKVSDRPNDYLNLADIEISLIKIDDNAKLSVCKAKFKWDANLDNEKEGEIIAKYHGARIDSLKHNKNGNSYERTIGPTYEISDNGRGENMIRVKR